MANILHGKEEQEENYAREILKEQMEQGWEGLTTEVAEICLMAGLQNVCKEHLNRKEVVEAIEFHHMKEVKEQMEPLKKMAKLKIKDTRCMQTYMKQKSLENSRLKYCRLDNRRLKYSRLYYSRLDNSRLDNSRLDYSRLKYSTAQ